LSKPLQDRQIRYLLLVAIYQLQYTKAAHHAIVDHAVKAARRLAPATSGLVNAVLRNFLRKQPELQTAAEQTEMGRYSYPHWWVAAVQAQYGQQADAILRAGNLHPPMTLRVNSKQATVQQYMVELEQLAINAHIVGTEAIMLEQAVPVGRLPGFQDGKVSVQDAGAQLAAHLLSVEDGMRVLDACAAPGGKTAHLLELAEVELIAIDKDGQRLQRVRENLQRLNLSATVQVGDAALPAGWWDGRQFQRILADVPCSASGVVRRHPDIKWLRRASDLDIFASQQQQIVAALWPLLAPGGKLLYATCSIFARENQQAVANFLSHTPDALQLQLTAAGMTQGQLIPNEQHDGFFYALLQKQT
jgi:16S rRNA (cytosine967-C5)-methyltransferase